VDALMEAEWGFQSMCEDLLEKEDVAGLRALLRSDTGADRSSCLDMLFWKYYTGDIFLKTNVEAMTRFFIQEGVDCNLEEFQFSHIQSCMEYNGGIRYLMDYECFDINNGLGRFNNDSTFPIVTELSLNRDKGIFRYVLHSPGVKVNTRCASDHPALLYSVECLEIYKSLILHPGIDVNIQDKKGGYTLLHFAILSILDEGKITTDEISDLLSYPTINVNAQDKDGYTALMFACSLGQIDAVSVLLDAPTLDINILSNQGYTALDIINIILKGEVEDDSCEEEDTDRYDDIKDLLLAYGAISKLCENKIEANNELDGDGDESGVKISLPFRLSEYYYRY
jgi:hypothetical protein